MPTENESLPADKTQMPFPECHVGIGYDVHRLVEGRQLILGGVEIPYPLGLAGHSDADVVAHAIADALLGAAALGDIGQHFPPGDPTYKGISSLTLLARVATILAEEGWWVSNVDATVVAERPKLQPWVMEMRRQLAQTLGLAAYQVSIKATTTEGLGFAGRGEGIGAYAVALIARQRP
jgi:2-C-methyl-D-erythritol 2,4-cyclodiphosphate synthase